MKKIHISLVLLISMVSHGASKATVEYYEETPVMFCGEDNTPKPIKPLPVVPLGIFEPRPKDSITRGGKWAIIVPKTHLMIHKSGGMKKRSSAIEGEEK